MLIDCIVLALLYTLRVVAGAAATEVRISFWLIALSLFLFLSLAFLKRFAELLTHSGVDVDASRTLSGRGLPDG